MVEVTHAVDVQRPAPAVFAFIADMSNNPAWQSGQESCTWTSPPPIGLGSTYEQRARFLGREIRSTFEVVEFEPDHAIRIRTTGGGMPMDITRRVEPLDERSARVAVVIRGGPTGPLAVLDPLTTRLVGRNVRADYERLVHLLESGGAD